MLSSGIKISAKIAPMTPRYNIKNILKLFYNAINRAFNYGLIIAVSALFSPLLSKKKKEFIQNKTKVAFNHTGYSIGHLTIELEWAYHIVNSDVNIDRIYFVFPRNKILSEFIELYSERDSRLIIIQSKFWYIFYQAFVYHEKDVGVDIGVSSNQLHTTQSFGRADYGIIYTKHMLCNKYLEKNKPLNRAVDIVANLKICNQLKDLTREPYFVLQIKDIVSNGTALVSRPSAFIEAIKCIQEDGFKVVLGGREKLPFCLQGLGIIEYSTMACASVKNDFWLVANAQFVISSPSGFNYIPFVLNKKTLVYGVYNFSYPSHPDFLILPQTMCDRHQKRISFIKQLNVSILWGQQYPEKVRLPDYKVLDTTEQDIINALNELMGRQKSNVKLQKRFNTVMHENTVYYSKSKIVSFVLEKYRCLY